MSSKHVKFARLSRIVKSTEDRVKYLHEKIDDYRKSGKSNEDEFNNYQVNEYGRCWSF